MGRGRGSAGGAVASGVETRLGTAKARESLPKLVKQAAAKTEPSESLLDDAVEIGSYRSGGALLIPAVDAQAHIDREAELEARVSELELEVSHLKLAQVLSERIEGRRAGRRGTPIEQVARELGFEHLVDGD